MKTCVLSLSIVMSLSLLPGCSRLGIHYGAHYQCRTKNLTSGQRFSGFGATEAQAKKQAQQRCVKRSTYGWRCSPQSCQPYQSLL